MVSWVAWILFLNIALCDTWGPLDGRGCCGGGGFISVCFHKQVCVWLDWGACGRGW